MKRRALVALAGAAPFSRPLWARAQQSSMPVIGLLSRDSRETFAILGPSLLDGLRETGHVEGRNFEIVFRWAEGRLERLPALAAELVALKVAVIVAPTGRVALATRQATRTIPIVFSSGADPVALGLVASFSRPGGNATGVYLYTTELMPKRLELVRDLIPSARSVAFLSNPDTPTAASQLADMQSAVRVSGFSLQVVAARTADDIEQAFVRLAEVRPDALLVASDPLFASQGRRIMALAARHSVPTIYETAEFPAAGGLISFGPSIRDSVRMLGVYAGKIVKGANPADLPVQQPTRFELVVNLNTAKALGLAIPPALLDRADKVIE